MVSRVVVSVYVAVLVFAAGIAFFGFRDYDEQTITGASTSLSMMGTVRVSTSRDVVAQLEGISARSGVTIAKLDFDTRGADRSRYLSVTTSAPQGRDWVRDGFPAFSTQMQTHVRPMAAIDAEDPRGMYLVIGDRRVTSQVRAILESTGGTVQVDDETSVVRLVTYYLIGGPMLWSVVVALLGAAVAVGCGVVLDSRRYAVQRLHGWAITRLLVKDLVDAARRVLLVAPVVVAVVAAALWFYNHGARTSIFALAWVGIAGAFLAAVAVFHAVVLWVMADGDVLAAVRGKLRTRPLLLLLRTGQVAAVLLAVTLSGLLASTSAQLAAIRGSDADWGRFGSVSAMSIGGARASDPNMLSIVGRYSKGEVAAGRAIIASAVDPGAVLPSVPASMSGWRIMIVSAGYLKVTGLTDPLASEASSATALHVLTPAALKATSPEVSDIVRTLVSRLAAPDVPIRLGPLVAPDGVVSFGNTPLGGLASSGTRAADTIVVVLPTALDGLDEHQAAGLVTQSGLLFLDRAQVLRDVASSAELQKYVGDVRALSEVVAAQELQMSRQLSLLWPGMVAALLTLVALSIALAIVYAKANVQRLWVQTFSGWPPLVTHWRFMVFDVALVSAVLAWQASTQIGARSVLNDPSAGYGHFQAQLTINAWAVPGSIAVAAVVLTAMVVSLQAVGRRLTARKASVA